MCTCVCVYQTEEASCICEQGSVINGHTTQCWTCAHHAVTAVTIHPGLPRHVVIFSPCLGVRAGFPKMGHMSRFCTLKPADYHKFLKVNTKHHCLHPKFTKKRHDFQLIN